MDRPPAGSRVPQYLRTRCEWAARLLIYLGAHHGGSQAVCTASIFFILDALFFETRRRQSRDSYLFLSSIIADSYIDAHSYAQYFERAAGIRALHDQLRHAGFRLFNTLCALRVTPLKAGFDATARANGINVEMFRGLSINATLNALEARMRTNDVGMAQIAPMLTGADVPTHWKQAFWAACAGTLDDFIAIPFRQHLEKPFNKVADSTVKLYDTVTYPLLHYDRHYDFTRMIEFDCVIVPLRSGLRLALFKPVDAALTDILRLGAIGCFMSIIESALSKPLAPIHLEMPELIVEGGTLALQEIFQGIVPPGFDIAIFRDADLARLGVHHENARGAPLRDIFHRSHLRIRCDIPQPGGSGDVSGEGCSGLGSGAMQQPSGSGLGGGAMEQPGGSGLGGGAGKSLGGQVGASPGRKRGAPAPTTASGQAERGRQASQPPTAKTRRRSRSQPKPATQPVHKMTLRSRADTQPRPDPPTQAPRHIAFDESFCYIVFLDEPITGQYESRHIAFAGTFRRAAGEPDATLPGTLPSFSQEESDDEDEAGGSAGGKKPVVRRQEGLGGQCGAQVQSFDYQPL